MPSSNDVKPFTARRLESTEFQRTTLVNLEATSGFQVHPATQKALSRDVKQQAEVEAVVQERVKEVLNELKSRSEAEGYQSGLKRGHEEALKRFQNQASESLAQLEDLVRSVENHRAGLLAAQERALIDLIFQIGSVIALKEISQDREYLKRLIAALAEKIGARENIHVILGLEDKALIEQVKSSWLDELSQLKHVSFEFSDRVTRGGCILETDWATVDGRVQIQMEQLQEALVKQSE